MTWKIEFDDRAARELRKLDQHVQHRILSFLRERIATADNPRRLGTALTGSLSGLWRYRIQDYRLICLIEDERLVVLILRVGHRKNIYY